MLIWRLPIRSPLTREYNSVDLLPEGRLVLATLCPINEPSIQLMNLWGSMTDGCGSLPYPEDVCDQLSEAGFDKVGSEKLIPGFYLFQAKKIPKKMTSTP